VARRGERRLLRRRASPWLLFCCCNGGGGGATTHAASSVPDYGDGVGLSAMFRKLLEAWACKAACSLILMRRRRGAGGEGTRGEEGRGRQVAHSPPERGSGEESEGKMERR